MHITDPGGRFETGRKIILPARARESTSSTAAEGARTLRPLVPACGNQRFVCDDANRGPRA